MKKKKQKKINNKCECCGNLRNNRTIVATFSDFSREQKNFPFIPNYTKFLCLECGLSYLTQYFDMDDKDIENYLDFIFSNDKKND